MTIILQETQRAVFYAPFYAALALDTFSEDGLKVDFRSSARPEDAATVLFTGAADVSWGGPMRVMLTRDQDSTSDLVCFCEVVTRDPFLLVGREQRPDFTLMDLKGLRLGVVAEVPTPWMCLQQDIRDAGVDPLSLHHESSRRMPENCAALRPGELDVVQLFEPFVSQMLEDGAGHIWHTAARRGPTSYTCLYTRKSILERRRPDFVKMVRGIHAAQTWIHANEAATIARAISRYFPDLSETLLTASIKRNKTLGIWGQTPWLPAYGYNR
ncbi:MAG: ABC transporter substrate-binding protein, partial [Hyphomicrobiales bacterium]